MKYPNKLVHPGVQTRPILLTTRAQHKKCTVYNTSKHVGKIGLYQGFPSTASVKKKKKKDDKPQATTPLTTFPEQPPNWPLKSYRLC